MIEVRMSGIKFKRKPNTEDYFKIIKALKTAEAFKKVTAKELAWYIGEGHSVILAKYKRVVRAIDSIGREHIEGIQLMTIDVETEKIDILDSEGNPTGEKKLFDTPYPIERVEGIIYRKYGIKPLIRYKTFSHTEDNPRARLIYYIDRPVTVEEYQAMLSVFIDLDIELEGRIDKNCKNANRIWQGTNFPVEILKDYISVNEELIQKLLKSYEEHKPKLTERKPIVYNGTTGNLSDLGTRVKIKKEAREEVKAMINQSIDIIEFLSARFGLSFGRHSNTRGNIINCSCPIHGGQNEKGFAIYKSTNTAFCWGDCYQQYNVLKLGYLYYGKFSFNEVALTLIEEYNLPIEERWLEIY